MKKQLAQLAIGILLWLHSAASVFAVGNPPPSTRFYLPVSRAGHAWEMHIKLSSGSELVSANAIGGANVGFCYTVSFELPPGWDTASWESYWLVDVTDGGTRTVPNQTSVFNGPFLYPGETSTQYFTVPSDRAGHALAVKQPGDIFTSVTVGEEAGVWTAEWIPGYSSQAPIAWDGDGNPTEWGEVWVEGGYGEATFTSYGYCAAWAAYDPFFSFQVMDFTALEEAQANATDVYANIGCSWVVYSGAVPVRPVTFFLPRTDAGRTFTLYGGNGGANTQFLTAYASTLTDPSTGSQQQVSAVSGQVGVGQLFWLLRHADWATNTQTVMPIAGAMVDLRQSFGDLGQNQNLQTLSFSIRDTRDGHAFKIVHADGHEVPVDFATWANGYTAYSWDDQGNVSTANFWRGTAEVDTNQAWSLVDDVTQENYGATQQVADGWVVMHPAVVAPSTASFAVFAGRSTHDLRLRLPDGTEYPVTNLGHWGTMGFWDWANGTYQTVEYDGGSAFYDANQATFTLHDVTVGDASPPAYDGWGDFSMWLPPQSPLMLNISPTRWGHTLYLQQASGISSPLTPGSIQGAWVAWNGGSSFTTYGYFDAAAYFYQGLDYWIYDATAGETSPANTSDLTGWASSQSNNDYDGDGLPDWYEAILGTYYWSWDSDGDGIPDGWETTHNLSAVDGSNGWMDSDGDGTSDYQEYLLGTHPLSAAPQLAILSPGNAHLE